METAVLGQDLDDRDELLAAVAVLAGQHRSSRALDSTTLRCGVPGTVSGSEDRYLAHRSLCSDLLG